MTSENEFESEKAGEVDMVMVIGHGDNDTLFMVVNVDGGNDGSVDAGEEVGGCVFPMVVMLLVKTVIRLVIRLMEVEEFDHPTLTIVNEDEPQVSS